MVVVGRVGADHGYRVGRASVDLHVILVRRGKESGRKAVLDVRRGGERIITHWMGNRQLSHLEVTVVLILPKFWY